MKSNNEVYPIKEDRELTHRSAQDRAEPMNKIELMPGDCLHMLPTIEANSIDSCVTDPPYHLVSIVKRFGNARSAPLKNADEKSGRNGPYQRSSKGFMGKQWDGGDIAFRSEIWREVYRVLKPGAHLIAFGGTRTYHRLACAIEDAGFEIRDTIMWLYGSGWPKSHNIGNGWGTALKPACEPIVLARKPLSEKTVAANVLKWGTGAINVGGCIVETGENLNGGAYSGGDKRREDASAYFTGTKAGEFIQPQGRWPANVIHDGSEEVVAGFPETGISAGGRIGNANGAYSGLGATGFTTEHHRGDPGFGDSGSAARFFYTAKADVDDRLGSKHPTVKPLDLMQYLVRLITSPGGTVLDLFAGTGVTGEAAFREGMRAVLIERETEYQADIKRRIKLILSGPDERRRESIKAKNLPLDHGPLFSDKFRK